MLRPILGTERLQRNFSCFAVNLPLYFPEMFNIFSSFLRIQENFRKKNKTMIVSGLVDERSTNFQENHNLWLQ